MNKNNFAKRLIPILLCISLVLSIIGRLSAYAIVSDEFWGEGRYPLWNEVDCRSWFDSQNITYTDDYMCINLKYNSSESGSDFTSYTTYYFDFLGNAEYSYDENNYIVITSYNFHGKYGREGRTYINNNGDLSIGRLPAGFANSSALNYIRDSITLKFKEDMSDFYINDVHFTASDIEYFSYEIGEISNRYSSIKVQFSPDLVGEVDRSFDDHGKTGYFENFDFEIWNRGDTAIQYKWYIVEKNQTNTRPVITNQNETYKQYDTLRYDDDEVFIYYTKDWVFSTETEVEKHASDKNGSWLNPNIFHKTSTEPKLRYKGTDWHYLEAGGYKHQPIYYSQVNLKEGTEYTVYVLAQTCPYTSASTIWSDEGNTDNKSLTAAEYDIVYQSDFTMLQYSDVKYDPEDSRNGVLPYDGYQGLLDQTVYDVSYDAEQDSNGNINYSGFNFDKSQIPDTYGNTPSNIDGGAEIISNTSGVFRFFSVIFGVFPPEVNKILSISLWVGFALFLIRRLT